MHNKWLIPQILAGIIAGVILALAAPAAASSISVLGVLFVSALKAAAPLLVFVLVMSAVASHQAKAEMRFSHIIGLYVLGTFVAAVVAVLATVIFQPELTLISGKSDLTPPLSIPRVLGNLLVKMVDNPLNALITANFIGVLAWAIALGCFLQKASSNTKDVLADMAKAVTNIVQLIIRFAPLGIVGLVAGTVAESGLNVLAQYVTLLITLLSSMLFVALVANPLIVWAVTRINPYPLVLTCLKESGITAFFTRSSAANIPVNLALCEKLELNRKIYSVSIPLGASINMAGAAITITVMTLTAVNTLGIDVDIFTTLLLCVIACFAACGAGGVAGGSLLLIPLACNLFGIPTETAMQVVAVGFVIGVVQDSAETALNSSTDVVFTAICSGVTSSEKTTVLEQVNSEA